MASPTFSVRSWDSHAIYQHPAGQQGDDEAAAADGGRRSRRRVGGFGPGPPYDDDEHVVGMGDPEDDHDDDEEEEDDDPDGVRVAGSGRFPSARSLQAIFCYCDASALRAPRTILRILLLVRKFNY